MASLLFTISRCAGVLSPNIIFMQRRIVATPVFLVENWKSGSWGTVYAEFADAAKCNCLWFVKSLANYETWIKKP